VYNSMTMSLRTQLPEMIKTAMKARDQVRLDTIRFVYSQAKNQEIDLKRELNDEELITLMKREIKNRQEAIEQFRTAGRDEIVREEEVKLAIIQEMAPAEISDDEIQEAVKRIADTIEDKSFGSVMRAVMTELKGKADGKRISEAVKQLIQ